MALNGWLKLHRALSDHPIASDPQSLSVWIHLLMLANHVETKRQINGRIVTLSPGQLIASRKSLSAKTGVQESKVERVLKMLQNEQQIEQHGTSKYRVISIVNWDSYQGGEQQNEQQMNSTRTAREHQMNTPEEVIPNGITEECEEGEEKDIRAQGKPERKKSMGVADLVALGVEKQHAKDWIAARKAKRLPLTETALDGVKREAEKAGITLPKAIGTAAAEGWAGFKASWLTNQKGSMSAHHGLDKIDHSKGLGQENADGSFGF